MKYTIEQERDWFKCHYGRERKRADKLQDRLRDMRDLARYYRRDRDKLRKRVPRTVT